MEERSVRQSQRQAEGLGSLGRPLDEGTLQDCPREDRWRDGQQDAGRDYRDADEKAAIHGKMSDRRLLLQFVEAHEARETKREEARLKKQADGSEEIDWDVEREETYQRLLKMTAEIVQLPAPTE
jgi:hypothetical protein